MEFKRRRPERFLIYTGEDEVYTISPETALKHGFAPGKEFGEEEFIQILNEDAVRRAKDQALRYLEIRPHSRRELAVKLLRKGYSKEATEQSLDDLEKVDLINDEKFVRLFIQNELLLRPCSKNLLRKKIIQRGVKPDLFEPILNEAYQEHREEEIALQTCEKFLKIHHHLPPQKLKKKLTRHLLGKGFSWDIIGWIFRKKNL